MFHQQRLLIIDSSDSFRAILLQEISKVRPDIDILTHATGKQALAAVARHEFEIITTGMDLEDMDGYTVIENIRQSEKNQNTAIFVVSGDTNTQIKSLKASPPVGIAYFNKAEGHKMLVKFILSFLNKAVVTPISVLYVDESATSTAITSAILNKHSIQFMHFKEAEEALSLLRKDIADQGKCRFDMVITDQTLSRQMSGFDLIHSIRDQLQLDYLTLPTLLMTVEPLDDEKTDFSGIFGAGTNDFITKPLDEDNFLDRIQTLAKMKRQNAASKS